MLEALLMIPKYYLSKSSLACYPKFEVDHEGFPVHHDDLVEIDEPTFAQINRVKNGDAALNWQGDTPVVREFNAEERMLIDNRRANIEKHVALWAEFSAEYDDLHESALAGIISDDERARMAALLTYRRALDKVNADDSSPDWPSKPE